MKGVILAGGRGRRLRPLSLGRNKHLLPVHDQPMVCYPLGTLVQAGIRQILVVTNADDEESFRERLGDGQRYGCRLTYARQGDHAGTGAALLAAREFVGRDKCVVALGDNIFTEDVSPHVYEFEREDQRFPAKILVHEVTAPGRYGIVVFRRHQIVDVVEKPEFPPSRFAVTGLWMFLPSVFERVRDLRISARGEYEMTDVLAGYAREGLLAHAFLKSTWMDVGTFDSLGKAKRFFEVGSAGDDIGNSERRAMAGRSR